MAAEVAMASDPTDRSHLLNASIDLNCRRTTLGIYTSSDKGREWGRTCVRADALGGADPSVGYDLSGIAYAVGLVGNDPLHDRHALIQKSFDNGDTWSEPIVAVSSYFPHGTPDTPRLAVDQSADSPRAGALYVAAVQVSPKFKTVITVSHSIDGGETWQISQVDPVQSPAFDDGWEDIVVDGDGTVYVAWQRCRLVRGTCGGTRVRLLLAKSTDGGVTWNRAATIAKATLAPDTCGCSFYGNLPNTGEPVSDIPAIDTDRSGGPGDGNLYASFYMWTGSSMQVEMSRSVDHGLTWSDPMPLAPLVRQDQFFPWLSVSATGMVGVSWLDRRNDPNNLTYETFVALSGDGGASFGDAIDVAEVPSNPMDDGFGGNGGLGDYTGNTWAGGRFFVAWPDTRTGVSQDEVGGIAL